MAPLLVEHVIKYVINIVLVFITTILGIDVATLCF